MRGCSPTASSAAPCRPLCNRRRPRSASPRHRSGNTRAARPPPRRGTCRIGTAGAARSTRRSRRSGIPAIRTRRSRRTTLPRAACPRPPPFDVLLLADTGQGLADVATVLPTYGVAPPAVRIVGPALWASPSSGAARLTGAWYAAPDPAARLTFDQSYRAHYGTPALPISDLAFDAASIARVLAGAGGYSHGQSDAADRLQRRGRRVSCWSRTGRSAVASPCSRSSKARRSRSPPRRPRSARPASEQGGRWRCGRS